MLILFIKFFLAHIIGDFLFQPSKWVSHKQKHKFKSKYLYWHLAIHTLALLAVFQFNLKYWIGMLCIVLSHFGIDLAKIYLTKKVNRQHLFFFDQLAHLLVIALVVKGYTNYSLSLDNLYCPKVLLFVTAVICTTVVSSIIMKVIIDKWQLKENNDASLKHAGAYIGILERLFIFGFIIMGYWQGVGFLLAAKSVFRFGDLSKAKDRKLTEYILIGTLLSFGLAILCGLVFKIGLEYLS